MIMNNKDGQDEPVTERTSKMTRQFIAIFHFTGWSNIQLGISISIKQPNLEIHVPFGFIRVGWVLTTGQRPINHLQADRHTYGLGMRYKDPDPDWSVSGIHPLAGVPLKDALYEMHTHAKNIGKTQQQEFLKNHQKEFDNKCVDEFAVISKEAWNKLGCRVGRQIPVNQFKQDPIIIDIADIGSGPDPDEPDASVKPLEPQYLSEGYDPTIPCIPIRDQGKHADHPKKVLRFSRLHTTGPLKDKISHDSLGFATNADAAEWLANATAADPDKQGFRIVGTHEIADLICVGKIPKAK